MTPIRSVSFSSAVYSSPASMAWSIFVCPGTPVAWSMDPDRSMTRTESTGGGTTDRPVSDTGALCPSVLFTIRSPSTVVGALAAVNAT